MALLLLSLYVYFEASIHLGCERQRVQPTQLYFVVLYIVSKCIFLCMCVYAWVCVGVEYVSWLVGWLAALTSRAEVISIKMSLIFYVTDMS